MERESKTARLKIGVYITVFFIFLVLFPPPNLLLFTEFPMIFMQSNFSARVSLSISPSHTRTHKFTTDIKQNIKPASSFFILGRIFHQRLYFSVPHAPVFMRNERTSHCSASRSYILLTSDNSNNKNINNNNNKKNPWQSDAGRVCIVTSRVEQIIKRTGLRRAGD